MTTEEQKAKVLAETKIVHKWVEESEEPTLITIGTNEALGLTVQLEQPKDGIKREQAVWTLVKEAANSLIR